ncbi:sugar ABC transporter substrate-binding protein [Aminipila sp.]|uniref:sugar ABC transporter substrate-binding protein n=1 Tax=Aminipila sp. TaxID=2060095 RepID=UPI0028A11086|nr:sugar ABC transporter substrate-binding protein [Aminipila sp.]
MKKKILSILLVLTLLLATLVGCGNTDSKPKTDDKEGKTYKVAYIARAQSDSFAAWLANEMKAAAKEYKDIDLEVFDGQADDEKENAAIENAIANGFDAIIVQPNNGEAQRPYVEQIVDAGIIAITTNARIDNIKGASSVDADPYVQAKVNAEAAIKQVPKNGRVVVLKGPSGNFHADQRLKAWKEVFFAARPDVKIVGEDFANWNKDEAMQLMEDWVTSQGKIDAIISMNDNMAAGALEVVKDNPDYANILSYGVDGTAEACLLIEQGKMTSTCLQSAIDLAKLNMETVHKLLTGEETQIDTDIDAPLITKDNASEYVKIYRDRGLITE